MECFTCPIRWFRPCFCTKLGNLGLQTKRMNLIEDSGGDIVRLRVSTLITYGGTKTSTTGIKDACRVWMGLSMSEIQFSATEQWEMLELLCCHAGLTLCIYKHWFPHPCDHLAPITLQSLEGQRSPTNRGWLPTAQYFGRRGEFIDSLCSWPKGSSHRDETLWWRFNGNFN